MEWFIINLRAAMVRLPITAEDIIEGMQEGWELQNRGEKPRQGLFEECLERIEKRARGNGRIHVIPCSPVEYITRDGVTSTPPEAAKEPPWGFDKTEA